VWFPAILGWDAAGRVLSLGPGVSEFSIGDRVLAWAYHTYAELRAVKAEPLAKGTDGLDLAEAAAAVKLAGLELARRIRKRQFNFKHRGRRFGRNRQKGWRIAWA
jgi:NADPH:quinone reductase-like Zn-dependent oxidoreductase